MEARNPEDTAIPVSGVSDEKRGGQSAGDNEMSDNVTVVDASGLKCPLPVLKARKAIKSLGTGMALRVISTDPASPLDFRHFCNTAGHELLSVTEGDGRHEFLIRKVDA